MMGQRYIDCINCKGNKHRELIKVIGNRGVDFISYQHHIVVCNDCGLVFVNPQHDEQDYDKFYKTLNYKKLSKKKLKKAISKEIILNRFAYKKIPLKFFMDYLQKDLTFEIAPKVLDVGCGFGALVYFMQECGLKAEGLDQSVDMIDFAQNQLGLKVHTGSIFSHNLLEDHYDVVTSTAVMEHFTDPMKALKQMRKLLKRDGLLLVNTIDLKGMILRRGIERYFKFVHTFYYTNVLLSSLIRLAGFKIIKSWQMRPILKYSNFFYPENACSGELNIIAQKKNLEAAPLPLKEDPAEIFRVFKKARKRDWPYIKLNDLRKRKLLGLPFRYVRKTYTKPHYVFRDYFQDSEVVADYQNV